MQLGPFAGGYCSEDRLGFASVLEAAGAASVHVRYRVTLAVDPATAWDLGTSLSVAVISADGERTTTVLAPTAADFTAQAQGWSTAWLEEQIALPGTGAMPIGVSLYGGSGPMWCEPPGPEGPETVAYVDLLELQ
jgi:hypothetical protein